MQIEKACKAFGLLKRLFLSQHLNKQVKLICYQTLIRPILTYGAPIWYNISSATMEKLRVFERKCLRACLSKYRKAENKDHYISNKTLYNYIKFDRIDIFILEQIRKHIVRSTTNNENSMIYAPYLTEMEQFKEEIENKFPPLESFIYLDQNSYTQNHNTAIPLLYHINRRKNNKSINPNVFNDPTQIRFNTNISNKSVLKHVNNIEKYWWLCQNS